MKKIFSLLAAVAFVGTLFAQVPPVKTDKVKAPIKKEAKKGTDAKGAGSCKKECAEKKGAAQKK